MRHGELSMSYSECGCSLVYTPTNVSENVWVRMGPSHFFSMVIAVFRSCLWNIHNFKTLPGGGEDFFLWLIYGVTLQFSTLCSDSPGVSEDCFLGRKNYKVGQNCWLCHSRLVHATLWSLCQGFGWVWGSWEGTLKRNISCCGLAALKVINVLEQRATVWEWGLLPGDPTTNHPALFCEWGMRVVNCVLAFYCDPWERVTKQTDVHMNSAVRMPCAKAYL